MSEMKRGASLARHSEREKVKTEFRAFLHELKRKPIGASLRLGQGVLLFFSCLSSACYPLIFVRFSCCTF